MYLMSKIETDSPLTKYQQVRGWLLEQLTTNQYKIGQRFYSENEIANIFNVSPLTVRKAFSILEAEGFLRREQGVGTFVSSIVGYGDNVLAMYTNPALTCVKTFTEEIGRKSVELLINVLKDPFGTPKENYYPTKVVERDSCRALL
jgi:DNA-binding GntR family transcriptional regulator